MVNILSLSLSLCLVGRTVTQCCWCIVQVRVWGRTYEHAQRLVHELSARHDTNTAGMTVKVCATAKQAVTDADVICTVTFATTPVISHDWVKPGAHING